MNVHPLQYAPGTGVFADGRRIGYAVHAECRSGAYGLYRIFPAGTPRHEVLAWARRAVRVRMGR